MAMQVWPSTSLNVAVLIWAVVTKVERGIRGDLFRGIFDANVVILYCEVVFRVVLEVLVWVLGEDDIFGLSLERKF